MPDQFEMLIEARLKAELAPLVASAATPAAGSFLWLGRRGRRGLATTGTVALGFAVVFAVAGGMIAATAFTGSSSPGVWTRQVEAAVSQCRVVFDPGERGVGHCADDGIATATQPKPNAPVVVRRVPASVQSQAPLVGSGVAPGTAPATTGNASSGGVTGTQSSARIGPMPSPTPSPTLVVHK